MPAAPGLVADEVAIAGGPRGTEPAAAGSVPLFSERHPVKQKRQVVRSSANRRSMVGGRV